MSGAVLRWLSECDPVLVGVALLAAVVSLRLFLVYAEARLVDRAFFGRR